LPRVASFPSHHHPKTARSLLPFISRPSGCLSERKAGRLKLKENFGSIARASVKPEEKERTGEMATQLFEGSLDWWNWLALDCGRMLSLPKWLCLSKEMRSGKPRGERFGLRQSYEFRTWQVNRISLLSYTGVAHVYSNVS
jgi:hypothetical protein